MGPEKRRVPNWLRREYKLMQGAVNLNGTPDPACLHSVDRDLEAVR